MENDISPSIQSYFNLSFDPVFLTDDEGLILDRNAAASLCFPNTTVHSLDDLSPAPELWQNAMVESLDRQRMAERYPVELSLSGEMKVNSTVRIMRIKKDELSEVLFLVSVSLGHSGLDAIRSYAQMNDRRVEQLSAKLTEMGKELLAKTNLLVEERHKILTIIKNMGDGLVACDRDGAIIQCNETAAELLHLPADRIGMPFVDACPSLSLAVKLDPRQPEIKHPVELNLPYKQRELRVHVSPVLDDKMGYAGFVLIIQDRTKQAEIDRMKSELISIVSHELRSPLTSIKGYIDLMQSGDFGAVPDEMNGYLDVIADNANRLSALIEDMLDLSKIESGKLNMNFGKVDIRYVCEAVYLTLKPQADQKRQTLKRSVEEGMYVSGDVERLQQALTNLVSNAVKYTPDQGTISIDAGRIQDEIWIRVKDNGYGIPAEQQSKIFQKFFRAKTQKNRHIGGTGLGLCITQSIAELHQGSVAFESEEGKGSTFTLKLPAYQI